MDRKHLTDDLIAALEFTPDSRSRYEIYDASVESLAVRVGSKTKSFVLAARFAGRAGNTTRRTLGRFPKMNTQAARVAADQWIGQIGKGVDPAIEVAKARRAETLRRRGTFASVMADYLAYLPSRDRNLRAQEDIKFLKRNLLNPATNPWLNKPISEVTAEDVKDLVRTLKMRAPTQAYHCLSRIKTFFRWLMNQKFRVDIGLKHNPVDHLMAKDIPVSISARLRILDYEEVYAYLKATSAMSYPFGPCLRVLMETGQRIGVVSGMRWSQLNLERKLWTIPGTKSKQAAPGRTAKVVDGSYQVPLSDRVVEMLRSIRDSLPAGHGDFVFSFSNGQTPLGNFSNLKRPKSAGADADLSRGRFERLMRAALEELGFEYDPSWWHDVRRTVRTHMEPITGRSEVADAAVGHGKTGIQRVYNLYKYRAEIRRAFNAWSALLQKVEEGTCSIADWEHDPEAFREEQR